MSVAEIINRRDIGTLASLQLQARESVCLSGPVQLAKGRVHEVMGDSADMFAILTASRLMGPIIWIGLARDIGSLAPTALQDYIDPARVILTEGISRSEVLWAAEQALRATCAQCVVVELSAGPNLRESRRLQIAAQEGGGVGLVLIHGRAHTSACETRWHCAANKSGENSWVWSLMKNRRGELGAWRVSWTSSDRSGGAYEAGVIHLAAATAA
ncbi:ImuA family protein [Fretibacter rubidus]|uniref:ImuA family protein n=1 Tax=Fretibacter rubidus TaxID=570162 RepID=UPI00352AC97E